MAFATGRRLLPELADHRTALVPVTGTTEQPSAVNYHCVASFAYPRSPGPAPASEPQRPHGAADGGGPVALRPEGRTPLFSRCTLGGTRINDICPITHTSVACMHACINVAAVPLLVTRSNCRGLAAARAGIGLVTRIAVLPLSIGRLKPAQPLGNEEAGNVIS